MSQLHKLVEELIETLKFGVHIETTKTNPMHPSLSQDYTDVLNEINAKLTKTTREQNPDLAILQLIFHTVTLIHDATRINRYLDDGLKTQIVFELFDLVTTVNMLSSPLNIPNSPMKSSESLDGYILPGSPRQSYGEYQQIEYNGLLDVDGYTPLGNVIHERFDELLQLSHAESDELSLKIASFVEQYQLEVMPLHQRIELERTVSQLQAQVDNLTTKQRFQEAEIARLRLLNAQLDKNQNQSVDSSRLKATIAQQEKLIKELQSQLERPLHLQIQKFQEAEIARLRLLNSQLELDVKKLQSDHTKQRKFDAEAARLQLESRQMKETLHQLSLPLGKSSLKPATPPPATTAHDINETQALYPTTFFPTAPRSPTTRVMVAPPSSSSLTSEHSNTNIIHSNGECCSM